MEKEHQPDSMATVTMKPDYPPSEVYSTSEPPPAYRHRPSNSVQIARIAALTVVAASFILGAFILASSWIAARASCHQLEQLDAMLDKELALEGRSYGNDGLVSDEPLPVANAHALHGVPPPQASVQPPPPPTENIPASPAVGSLMKDDALNHAESKINEDKLQNVDDSKDDASSDSSEDSSESDNSSEDDDELDARPIFKLPINFDLDELAGAFLANNQKGRMNCVVERRREDPLERRFPFNLLKTFSSNNAPQAERIAIICHGGDEARPSFPEPTSQMFDLPLARPMRPLFQIRPKLDRPLSPLEARMPLPLDSRMPSLESRMPPLESRMPSFESRMPSLESRMPPFGNMPQQRASSFPLPLPWDSSEENASGPREMRIHVQRVFAIPAPHNMPPPPESMGPFPPPPPPQNQEQTEQRNVIHQFVPQPAPTQELEQPEGQKPQADNAPVQMGLPWGLTPEDLHMIHRTAEEAVANHQQQQRDQQIDNDMQEVQMKNFMETLTSNIDNENGASEPQQVQEREQPPTLMMPQQVPAEERPHYVQPRSVRSVDSLLHREKRVKRCSCDCA